MRASRGLLSPVSVRFSTVFPNRLPGVEDAVYVEFGLGRNTRYSETGRIRALLRSSSNRIQVVDEMPAGGDPAVFYDRVVSDRRGLPCSEGVVVKDNNDPAGAAWYKVKHSGQVDLELVDVVPGSGKFATSAGGIERTQPCDGCLDPSREGGIPVRSTASPSMPTASANEKAGKVRDHGDAHRRAVVHEGGKPVIRIQLCVLRRSSSRVCH